MTADHYVPAPGLVVAVAGHRTARDHFAAEYGASLVAPGASAPPSVVIDVQFATRLPAGRGRAGHKTVRWWVDVGRGDGRPLRATLVLAGRPRRFALSLVQGFVVEPLVSLAAAGAGYVLLPAAALEDGDGAVVLIGRSRSGKTSVVARAVAGGQRAWGDDQVLLDAAGGVRAWPRRLRVYPDLRTTAPAAVAALPLRKRARLTGLACLAAVTRGWVAPSLPLAWRDLGGVPLSEVAPTRRVVVIERGGAGGHEALLVSPLASEAATVVAAAVIREQRSRLRQVLDAGWDTAFKAAEAAEDGVLRRALGGLPAQRWTVPAGYSAAEAVSELASRLGVRS